MLPIESNQEVLTEYGRAFAWINSTEFMLEQVILYKGKINLLDEALRKKIIGGKTLGQKIELSSSIVDTGLVKKLKSLNQKRVVLAHGVLGQKVTITSKEIITGDHTAGKGDKVLVLSIESLKEVIDLARSVNSELLALFQKNMGSIQLEDDVID